MKLAVSNIAWPPHEAEAAYALLAAHGFTGLEIAPGLAFAGEDDAFQPSAGAVSATMALETALVRTYIQLSYEYTLQDVIQNSLAQARNSRRLNSLRTRRRRQRILDCSSTQARTVALVMRGRAAIWSASRAAMALVFLVALSIDPSEYGGNSRGSHVMFALLAGYLAGAAALIVIAWRSWWWEFRLAPWVHAVDTLAFVIAVYFSEATRADFNSPFMALTAFLLISATLRWGWFAVALTSVSLVLLNVVIGAGLFTLSLARFRKTIAQMA